MNLFVRLYRRCRGMDKEPHPARESGSSRDGQVAGGAAAWALCGADGGAPRGGRLRRRGATAIEYCFMLSLVMAVIILAVQHLGGTVQSSFTHADTKLGDIGLPSGK